MTSQNLKKKFTELLGKYLLTYIFVSRYLHIQDMEIRRDVFQAIADPVRRDILNLVAQRNMNLNSIAGNFEISRPAISQHIKILIECGLITVTQQGRERFCNLEAKKLSAVADWIEPFRKLWEERYDQLDELLLKMQKPKKTRRK